MRHATVDLWDLLEDERDDVAAIEDNIDDLVEEVRDEYGDYESFIEEAPERHVESIETTFDELEDRKSEQERQLESAEELLEELERDPEDVDDGELGWGGTEFRLRALVTSDLAEIQDSIGATIENERDLENVEGAAMVETVDRMVEQSPDGAPDEIGQYPPMVTKLLVQKGGQLSGMGSSRDDAGNSSLRQRMETSAT